MLTQRVARWRKLIDFEVFVLVEDGSSKGKGVRMSVLFPILYIRRFVLFLITLGWLSYFTRNASSVRFLKYENPLTTSVVIYVLLYGRLAVSQPLSLSLSHYSSPSYFKRYHVAVHWRIFF